MARVLTILGTRPEIIRLSLVIPWLDAHAEHHVLYTGQNSDRQLRDVFFDELGVRPPDTELHIGSRPFAEQLGLLFPGVADTIARVKPDRVVILGDTNSGLAAILAARLGLTIFHLEAGNRSDDPRSPEEVNRRAIDHVSHVLMPYTQHSRRRLEAEGIPSSRIHVIGNPIFDVIQHFESKIGQSRIHHTLGLARSAYFLATVHRAETVDVPDRLSSVLDALTLAATQHHTPVVFPVHPRTRDRVQAAGVTLDRPGLVTTLPLGFFDFVALERSARAVFSDSGTVQEECAILGVPNIVVRDFTERPETVETGASIVTGLSSDRVQMALDTLLSRTHVPAPPADYVMGAVAERVGRLVTGPLPGR